MGIAKGFVEKKLYQLLFDNVKGRYLAHDTLRQHRIILAISEKKYSKLNILYPNSLYHINSDTNPNVIQVPYISSTTPGTKHNTTTSTFSQFLSVSVKNHYGLEKSEVGPWDPQNLVCGIGFSLKYKCLHRSFSENFDLGGGLKNSFRIIIVKTKGGLNENIKFV